MVLHLKINITDNQRRKCRGSVGDGTPPDLCFSLSPNECSRSQNINCLNRCDFYSRTTKYFRLKQQELLIGRGPLGQKVAKNAFSWHPSGEHMVCGLFERHIGTLPSKKFPSEKLARY